MQIPENPDNNDIRGGLIQLGVDVSQLREGVNQLREEVHQLNDKVEKIDYKFEVYQKGTDGMVRMATTIIIATASVVVLSSLSPAVTAILRRCQMQMRGEVRSLILLQ